MGSAASFQFCKKLPCKSPTQPGSTVNYSEKYETPILSYERCNDDFHKLLAVQEELDNLKIRRDRETMELVSYKLAVINSLNTLKKKLLKERVKNNRLWNAYCTLKYPQLYSATRLDNNGMLFDFSLTLMSSLRSIKQWLRNKEG